MDTKQLAYFVAVAKYRNFSRAAEEFYISQPAISHQIKMLERELGTELFVRNTKKVTLTPSGIVFLEDVQAILKSIDQAKQRLILAKQQPSVLRISYLSAATHFFLTDVVNQFHIQYPNIKVRLIRQDAYEISENISHQNADIYFSILTDLTRHPSLDVKKIQSDFFCLVTRKDHPALKDNPLDYKKLEKEPFLVFYPDHARYLYRQTMDLCTRLGFHPQISEQFNLYENLLEALEAGTGISILPYRSRSYMNTHNLAFTLLNIKEDLELGIGWEHTILNSAVPLFLNLFRKYMEDHPEIFSETFSSISPAD